MAAAFGAVGDRERERARRAGEAGFEGGRLLWGERPYGREAVQVWARASAGHGAARAGVARRVGALERGRWTAMVAWTRSSGSCH